MITPEELLDTSVTQLQILAAFLGDQLAHRSRLPDSRTPEARACEEIRLLLRAVIMRVEAERHLSRVSGMGIRRLLSSDGVQGHRTA
jgi:hypothetical protein